MKKQIVRAKEAITQKMPGWVTYDLIEPQTGIDIKTMRLGLLDLNPGEETKLHYHNCEEIFYIIEGTGCIEIDKVKYEVSKGDGVFVEPNLKHKTKNTSDKPLRYVFVCSQPQHPWSASDTITAE